MRFSSAVDSLTKENQFLRGLAKGLLLLSIALLGLVFVLYDKNPIMVERSSRGLEIVKPTALVRSESEIRMAIGLMLKARFNSDAPSPEIFLSDTQLTLRENEQRELKARSMSQNVIVREISISKDQATVDMDRVIALGDVRSALKVKVRIAFQEIAPNELNPFGLELSIAEPVVEIKEDKK